MERTKGSFWRTSIVCCCAQSCHGFLEILQKLKLSAGNGFKQPLIMTEHFEPYLRLQTSLKNPAGGFNAPWQVIVWGAAFQYVRTRKTGYRGREHGAAFQYVRTSQTGYQGREYGGINYNDTLRAVDP
ncbi:hypothetical protein DPMN_145852 [Dreissena polymorpha]|uniref:Uncharacterized protein n=1 Tax=Dreissena polymorpha TaxID=45954 RepID=A0A9D4F7I8_DREPO|nr:hypothetical protein DPMN_145852 [Dreissena polymorpha]